MVEMVESPKKKKARTGRANSNRGRSMGVNVQDKEGTTAATISLNEKVAESFWHKNFDFRRYNCLLF